MVNQLNEKFMEVIVLEKHIQESEHQIKDTKSDEVIAKLKVEIKGLQQKLERANEDVAKVKANQAAKEKENLKLKNDLESAHFQIKQLKESAAAEKAEAEKQKTQAQDKIKDMSAKLSA